MKKILAIIITLTAITWNLAAQSDLETKAEEAKANGDYNTAIQLYTGIINAGDENAIDAYFKRGMLYVYVQEYQKAVDDMDYVIDKRPDFADARNLRGLIYTYKPDYETALKDFNKAIELDPKFGAAYLNRAVAYIDTGKDSLALKDLDKAATYWADNPEIYYNRGNLHKQFRNWQAAADDYTSTILFSRDGPEIRYRRGNCYFMLEKWEQAIMDYTAGLEFQPDNTDFLNNRIVAYENMGRTMEATADKARMREIKSKFYPNIETIEYTTRYSADSTFQIDLPKNWSMIFENGNYIIADEQVGSHNAPRLIGRIFYAIDYTVQQGYKNPQETMAWWEGYIAKSGDNFNHYNFVSKKDKPYKGQYPIKYFKSRVQNVENGPWFMHFDFAVGYGKHLFHANLQVQEKDFGYFEKILDKIVGTIRLNNDPE